VEAGGIEPPSCIASTIASTWLVCCYRTANKAIRLSESDHYGHQVYLSVDLPIRIIGVIVVWLMEILTPLHYAATAN